MLWHSIPWHALPWQTIVLMLGGFALGVVAIGCGATFTVAYWLTRTTTDDPPDVPWGDVPLVPGRPCICHEHLSACTCPRGDEWSAQ